MVEPLSRKEAKIKGLTRFFTGVPCKHGHIAERSVCDYKCTECKQIKIMKWLENNTPRARAAEVRWHKENAEHCAKLRRKRQASAKYREKRADNYQRDREKVLLRVAKYAAENPDKYRQYKRNYKARKRGANGLHTAEEIDELLRRQKFKCAACKASLKDGYHADHVVPLILSGSNWISNIQLLCPGCNCSKGGKDPIIWAFESGRLL